MFFAAGKGSADCVEAELAVGGGVAEVDVFCVGDGGVLGCGDLLAESKDKEKAEGGLDHGGSFIGYINLSSCCVIFNKLHSITNNPIICCYSILY